MIALNDSVYRFWVHHRMKGPQWALRFRPPYYPRAPYIHSIVNANAGLTTRQQLHYDAGNLVAILKMMRERKANLRTELLRLAVTPGCLIGSARRSGYSRKWAYRLTGIRLQTPYDRILTGCPR